MQTPGLAKLNMFVCILYDKNSGFFWGFFRQFRRLTRRNSELDKNFAELDKNLDELGWNFAELEQNLVN